MKARLALQLFGLDAILHIIAIIFKIEWLIFGTKPLLMVFLAFYFHASVPKADYKKWMLLGLIFSFGGDLALLFHIQTEVFFMLGLGSFLIAHLYYTYGMSQFRSFESGLLFKKPLFGLPLIAYAAFLIYVLFPKLGDLAIPVIIYSMLIMLTGLSAINLIGRMKLQNAQIIIIGALLFILSDSVIALDKFLSTQLYIPAPRLIIMSTYILGQFLIVQGFIKESRC